MKLITEKFDHIDYITEGTDKKHHYIQGITLQADLQNRNGRIYPLGIMENEVNRYIKESIGKNRAYGELGHPQGPQINLDRVSHMFTELKRDGTNFISKARIAENTPMGSTALGLLECGASLGISSRGLGSLKPTKSGIMEVQSDFKLATAGDLVADPSAPDAFVAGIMENVEWFYNESTGSWLAQKSEDTKNNIKGMSIREIEEKKLTIFEAFIQSLSK